MSTELAITSAMVSPTEWELMSSQATSLVKSGLLPSSISTPEKALVIMLQGRELGIPPLASLNSIAVIQGRPTVSPQLMLALVRRTKELILFEVKQLEEAVEVRMQRTGMAQPYVTRFGKAQAQSMGLLGKDNYKKQPLVMYKWRAIGDACRTVFPDAVLGLYTADEMGANVRFTDDGDIVAQAITVDEPSTQPAAQPSTQPAARSAAQAVTHAITQAATPSAPPPMAPKPALRVVTAAPEAVTAAEPTASMEELERKSAAAHARLDAQIIRLWQELGIKRSLTDHINHTFEVEDGLGALSLDHKRSILQKLQAKKDEPRSADQAHGAAPAATGTPALPEAIATRLSTTGWDLREFDEWLSAEFGKSLDEVNWQDTEGLHFITTRFDDLQMAQAAAAAHS